MSDKIKISAPRSCDLSTRSEQRLGTLPTGLRAIQRISFFFVYQWNNRARFVVSRIGRPSQPDRAGWVRQIFDRARIAAGVTNIPRGCGCAVTTTAPGGATRITSYTHHGVGRLTRASQPDGTSVSYSYDAARRLMGVTGAKDNSVNYTLDKVGNRIGEDIKDPTGVLQRRISRSFDALNRVQQVAGAAR